MGEVDDFLAHHGVKGMKWGVIRKDERALGREDQALNISQRAQVKVASGISALAAMGMTTNAAATLFQLQARWERLEIVKAIQDEAMNNPFLDEAARESLAVTRNQIIKGIVGSALATTAISLTIGLTTQRAAKAYFAPLQKVYGGSKGKINSELRLLSKEVKDGKRASMTTTQYNKEVAKIVEKHMTRDKSNFLSPFHEMARSQLGTEYNTKALKIKFEKLPNTDLYSKMTVTTPHGLKMVKAMKVVEHSAEDKPLEFDFYFDYDFDPDGYIVGFSSPTIEVMDDILNEKFDVNSVESKFASGIKMAHSEDLESALAHFGVKGMQWGVRKVGGRSIRMTPKNAEVARTVGKEVGYGSIGPAALIAGVSTTGSISLGVTVAVLRQPGVQKAIASKAKASASLLKEVGGTSLSTMREVTSATKKAAETTARAANKTLDVADKAVPVADKVIDVALIGTLAADKAALLT